MDGLSYPVNLTNIDFLLNVVKAPEVKKPTHLSPTKIPIQQATQNLRTLTGYVHSQWKLFPEAQQQGMYALAQGTVPTDYLKPTPFPKRVIFWLESRLFRDAPKLVLERETAWQEFRSAVLEQIERDHTSYKRTMMTVLQECDTGVSVGTTRQEIRAWLDAQSQAKPAGGSDVSDYKR